MIVIAITFIVVMCYILRNINWCSNFIDEMERSSFTWWLTVNKLKNRDINLCHSDYQSSSSSTVLPYLLWYRKGIDTSCCIYLQSTYIHYFVYIELAIDHFLPYKMMGWTKKWLFPLGAWNITFHLVK